MPPSAMPVTERGFSAKARYRYSPKARIEILAGVAERATRAESSASILRQEPSSFPAASRLENARASGSFRRGIKYSRPRFLGKGLSCRYYRHRRLFLLFRAPALSYGRPEAPALLDAAFPANPVLLFSIFSVPSSLLLSRLLLPSRYFHDRAFRIIWRLRVRDAAPQRAITDRVAIWKEERRKPHAVPHAETMAGRYFRDGGKGKNISP